MRTALTSNVCTTEPSRPPAPRSWQWLLQGPGHQPGWRPVGWWDRRPVGWWDTRHDISRWGRLNKVRHPWYDMNIWYLWFLRWLVNYSWTPEPLKSVDKFSIKTPKWKDPNIDPLTSSPVTSSQAPLVVTTWSSPWDQPRSLDARYKAPRPASKCLSEKKRRHQRIHWIVCQYIYIYIISMCQDFFSMISRYWNKKAGEYPERRKNDTVHSMLEWCWFIGPVSWRSEGSQMWHRPRKSSFE